MQGNVYLIILFSSLQIAASSTTEKKKEKNVIIIVICVIFGLLILACIGYLIRRSLRKNTGMFIKELCISILEQNDTGT